MSKQVKVSTKIPEEIFNEFALRVPRGERSAFIRNAVIEKLQSVPRPDKTLQMEKRLDKLEKQLSQIKTSLADLEMLTLGSGKTNPHSFCIDEIDHKIVNYLMHYKGATTPELASHLNTNRWFVLNRLRRIQKSSKNQLGKPVVTYHSAEKRGKKKAWWLDEELVET
jgi:hypothetical protein